MLQRVRFAHSEAGFFSARNNHDEKNHQGAQDSQNCHPPSKPNICCRNRRQDSANSGQNVLNQVQISHDRSSTPGLLFTRKDMIVEVTSMSPSANKKAPPRGAIQSTCFSTSQPQMINPAGTKPTPYYTVLILSTGRNSPPCVSW